MTPRFFGLGTIAGLAMLCVHGATLGQGTGTEPPPAANVPPPPQGVEVLARGPIHEAFAAPATEPAPTQPVPKQPPKPLDEMPPDQKPEGDSVWIGGYWAWDDDRKDFLWVSGIWRKVPPGRTWVAGYWKEDGPQWRWVPGFWAPAQDGAAQSVNYLPAPPATPEVAPPGQPPAADSFYVPGAWVWSGERYVWQAGYWARVQPGYVWVAAHYRWTPSGYVYIPGYWDLAVADRGVMYAPVVVDPAVVGVGFVYTPTYVVRDTIVIDSLFVRPCYCHYYFGDYYGPAYREIGFESCIVYSRRSYDPIFVYATWEHRYEPNWFSVQLDVSLARHAGRAPVPPRTLVQQNTIIQQNITNVTNVTNVNNVNVTRNTTINNNQVLMPASQLNQAARGPKMVPVDPTTRAQMRQGAQSVRQVAMQRSQTEAVAPVGGGAMRPRTATLNLPPATPRSPIAPSSAGANHTSHLATGSAAQGFSSHPNSASPQAGVSSHNPAHPNSPYGSPASNPYGPRTGVPSSYSQPGRPGAGPTPFNRPMQGPGYRPPPPRQSGSPPHSDQREKKDHP